MMERHVQTIFCDDVRYEINGKVSYIGVYSAVLFVNVFPAILPKLCLAIKVVTPGDNPLQSLTLRVLKDDEELQEIIVGDDQLASASDLVSDLPDEDKVSRVQVTQFMLTFSPMQLDGPCKLRVLAQTESGELKGMALKVALAPIPINPTP
jgi:hypothetical protein